MLLRTLKRHRNGGARNDNKIDRHSHSKYRYNVVVFGTPSRTDASLVRSANKVIIPPVVKIVHKKKNIYIKKQTHKNTYYVHKRKKKILKKKIRPSLDPVDNTPNSDL